jgi:hypothetical protein
MDAIGVGGACEGAFTLTGRHPNPSERFCSESKFEVPTGEGGTVPGRLSKGVGARLPGACKASTCGSTRGAGGVSPGSPAGAVRGAGSHMGLRAAPSLGVKTGAVLKRAAKEPPSRSVAGPARHP